MRIANSERRTPAEPAPSRRFTTPRAVTVLALFVFCATAFCAVVGYGLIWQADERQALERRAALIGAIEDARNAGAELSALEPARVRAIERTAGLKELRFETEPGPAEAGREVQSVLDRQGRIIGWFSWLPDRSMGNVLRQMRPMLAVTGAFLIGFAAMALWQVHRALRDLGASEQIAWRLAHEDLLTGLPNYRKIIERIDETLALRAHGEVATLALIDLNGLNDVNDALGHAMGDALLIAVSARLKDLLPPHAVCGRFDGDQFAAVPMSPDLSTADTLFLALAGALARPFWINDQMVQVGVTIGFAHAPSDAQGRDDLMRRADLALRTAKKTRRGGALRFEPAMDEEFDERRFLERELNCALKANALQLHYQPIVSADGARILGAEALLRWNHPVRGAIPPDRFVPVAEASGLMKPLGEWVLRRALSDARRWPGLFVSVNLSPVQVRDAGLVDLVGELLAANRLPPERVVIEVTEGVLIDKPDEARARLDALRRLGVKLALDDFGTGYSSLGYLQRFRFDKLKIDRSFVAPLGRRADSQAMLQAIVALGRALDLGLLAEGVETEEQRVLLRLAGCDEMQGFLFARPVSAEALDKLLEESVGDRAVPRVA